jgi:glutamyl-tRNA reductase
VALETAEGLGGPVRDDEVLVVGAGAMGGLLARAAARAGATVTVANRSPERARSIAAGVGGRVADLDPGAAVDRFRAIFVALAGPWNLEAATATAIVDRRPAIVDLSVPTAVPAVLADGLGARLVTADDLARSEGLQPRRDRAADARTDALIEATVQAYLDWQARGDARAAADALVRHADLEREAELAALWRRLPALDPEAREAIEGMTRHLAARLLREPLERLGRDADGADGLAVRDLFAL